MLSIQAFSKKTGIPKSTLRFYEEKGLLIPDRNKENGYRLYRQEQIDLARTISSLRLANIPLKDIQRYMSASVSDQCQMKQTWTRALKAQKELLDVQIKYLESAQEEKDIFLFERPAERIIWMYAERNQGGFGELFTKGQKELKKQQIVVTNYYLKYESGRETVKAWIGFGIPENSHVRNGDLFEKEERISKSLCVATHFQGNFFKIVQAYLKLVKYVSDHHYIPTGSLMEMYHGNDLKLVTILMPVMKMGGEESETKIIR
ncbi:MerR family transcriptional regulator [Paucisalibacillus globulus]|uniref:MerR family transcriptional regulator n=1 Tax=Paucisalibacillus globulus TaxID=351095 RepID=UPI000413DAA8|nr:MerR family transcriptional regulator [Paucisalibacillus globulus]